jgi:tRNA U34 5-methylaminomethyl-2-thiouridine-forming methyltransferase MnmC
LERKIITTADGSKTIQLVDLDEQYHSIHGALQEANHVFIKHGLQYVLESQLNKNTSISILEIGFGTGLNALVTLLEAQKHPNTINYIGVEAYPISEKEVLELDYQNLFQDLNSDEFYKKIHSITWENVHFISPFFTLEKQQKFFHDIEDKNTFDLIYFDAFGARIQPELWTESVFKKMYEALKTGGILVTYSAKGSVRRAMQEVGFTVERLPGPPGKREMLRAKKVS